MAIYSDSVLELAVVDASCILVEVAESTATVSELLGFGVDIGSLYEQVSATSAVGGTDYNSVTSSVTATSSVSDSRTQNGSLLSTVTVLGSAVEGFESTVTESVAATSAVTDVTTVLFSLSSSATATGEGTPSVVHAASMADLINATSTVGQGHEETFSDTVTATSDMDGGKAAFITALSTATVLDSMVPATLAQLELDELAEVTDAFEHTAVTNAEGFEVIVLTSAVRYRDPLAPAWLMNTETTAMSRYSGFDFESVAQAEGVLYGVNADGIYAVRGNTDEGLKINAELVSGFLDLGTMLKKRIPYLYLGYKGDGRLKIDINTLDRKVTKATYYTAVLPAYQPVNTRMVLGKGLVGAYLQLTLSNVQGSYFDLDKWEVDVAVSTTRRMS